MPANGFSRTRLATFPHFLVYFSPVAPVMTKSSRIIFFSVGNVSPAVERKAIIVSSLNLGPICVEL